YTVAVALIYGTVAEHHFSDEYLHDPKIRALSQRVKVEISEEAERHMPQAMRCIFNLVTTSGVTHTTVVDYHRGHHKNPMSDAEVETKFRGLANSVMKDAQTDRLLEVLWKLNEVVDAGEMVRLT